MLEQYDDREIVAAMIRKDAFVTKNFLYEKCYPLFKSIYNNYYTDCDNCVEFINEIYVFIMTPHKSTNKSSLQSFGFSCTLLLWLKIVSENYCRQLYKRKYIIKVDIADYGDRKAEKGSSIDIDFSSLNHDDVIRIIDMMPNMRYRSLICYRYLENKSNEETAQLLEMTMDNYYNKHKLAKAQFEAMLRKEGLI